MSSARGSRTPLTRHALLPIAICSLLGALSAAVGFVAPVGQPLPDVLWSAGLGALVGWSVPRVPIWTVIVASIPISAMAATWGALLAVVLAAGLAAVSAFYQGWNARLLGQTRAALLTATATAGLLFWAMLDLGDRSLPFGSALATATATTVLTFIALVTLEPSQRRAVFGGIATVLVVVVGVGAVAVFQLQRATDSFGQAQALLASGVEHARTGDFDRAEENLEAATGEVAEAADRIGSPAVSIFSHVPVAGQNLAAAQRTLPPTIELLSQSQALLVQALDLDGVVSGNAVDLEHLETLGESIDLVSASSRELGNTLRAPSGPWVLPELRVQLEQAAVQTDWLGTIAGLEVPESLRSLLGGDEPRQYLVIFGNTAEARELGGFAGGTALLRIDRGEISIERADRPSVLNDSPGSPADFTELPPQRFLEHRPWQFSQNYTALADFPTLARALRDLYPSMGGEEIDGVAYLDPRAFAALLSISGEVHLEDANLTVSSRTVAPLLTVGQYQRFPDRDDREAFLNELITTTFETLTDADAASPATALSDLRRVIQQDRLLFVPFDPDEFATIEALDLTGALADRGDDDYLGVLHLNGGPNKLDAYTTRDVSYEASIDATTGEVQALVTITLTNNAPGGLSAYEASNSHGYRDATNRSVVVVHTPHEAIEWLGGDEPELTRSWNEFGLRRHERVVAVPAGESRTVSLRLIGKVASDGYRLHLGHQPLVHDDMIEVSLRPRNGELRSDDPRFVDQGDSLFAEFELTKDTVLDLCNSPASPCD